MTSSYCDKVCSSPHPQVLPANLLLPCHRLLPSQVPTSYRSIARMPVAEAESWASDLPPTLVPLPIPPSCSCSHDLRCILFTTSDHGWCIMSSYLLGPLSAPSLDAAILHIDRLVSFSFLWADVVIAIVLSPIIIYTLSWAAVIFKYKMHSRYVFSWPSCLKIRFILSIN